MKRLDKYLLTHHPTLWALRLHYLLLYALGLNALVLGVTSIIPFNNELMSDPILVFYGICFLCLMVLMLWLRGMAKFDTNKLFGVKHRKREFIENAFILFCVGALMLPLYLGMNTMQQRIHNFFQERTEQFSVNPEKFNQYVEIVYAFPYDYRDSEAALRNVLGYIKGNKHDVYDYSFFEEEQKKLPPLMPDEELLIAKTLAKINLIYGNAAFNATSQEIEEWFPSEDNDEDYAYSFYDMDYLIISDSWGMLNSDTEFVLYNMVNNLYQRFHLLGGVSEYNEMQQQGSQPFTFALLILCIAYVASMSIKFVQYFGIKFLTTGIITAAPYMATLIFICLLMSTPGGSIEDEILLLPAVIFIVHVVFIHFRLPHFKHQKALLSFHLVILALAIPTSFGLIYIACIALSHHNYEFNYALGMLLLTLSLYGWYFFYVPLVKSALYKVHTLPK